MNTRNVSGCLPYAPTVQDDKQAASGDVRNRPVGRCAYLAFQHGARDAISPDLVASINRSGRFVNPRTISLVAIVFWYGRRIMADGRFRVAHTVRVNRGRTWPLSDGACGAKASP